MRGVQESVSQPPTPPGRLIKEALALRREVAVAREEQCGAQHATTQEAVVKLASTLRLGGHGDMADELTDAGRGAQVAKKPQLYRASLMRPEGET